MAGSLPQVSCPREGRFRRNLLITQSAFKVDDYFAGDAAMIQASCLLQRVIQIIGDIFDSDGGHGLAPAGSYLKPLWNFGAKLSSANTLEWGA